ncbi:MAG: hypothetical protein ACI9E1_001986 [Cryomorphaceae bacterium]
MRILTTIFLTLCTAALCVWWYQDRQEQQDTSVLNESGAVPSGYRLFDNPALLDRHSISLSNKNGNEHVFQLNRYSLWDCLSPYQDRAAGILYLQPVLNFTMAAEVVEAIPVSQIQLEDYGFADDWVKVIVKDIHSNVAASYKIGIDSAWKHRVVTQDARGQQVASDIPTVYVIKEDAEDDDILYLVADPTFKIRSLFKNNFEGFRDHRPFALNLKFMEEIRIKQASREIVLDHSSPESPWRISKPLDLGVDTKALSKLLVDISNLTAIKLHQKDSVTLPQETSNLTQIIVKNFDSLDEVKLTVYPPLDENANTAYATISNRDVIFELPTQPIEGYKSSIASLPTSVNALRARNMLNLTRGNIRGFILRQPYTQPIIIARPAAGSNYELLTVDGKRVAPNEISIANLIAVVSKEPVKAFVSDAATDLSIYDFQNPVLTLDIRPLAGISQRLFFSRKDGRIYANLQGNNVVWEVDTTSFMRIAKNEWEWKSNIVWNLLKNDIIQLTVQHRDQEKITVNYDYLADTITAKSGAGNKDVTIKINPLQVKYFINTCSQLNARRRLGPDDSQAKKALENPIFSASITSQLYDDEANPSSTLTHTLQIAKASETATRAAYYYAKSNNDPDYFMITPAIYKHFTTDLFSEE